MTRYELLKQTNVQKLVKKKIMSPCVLSRIKIYETYIDSRKNHTKSNYRAVLQTASKYKLHVTTIYSIIRYMEG